MKYLKKLTAYIICVAFTMLSIANTLPVKAANESNTEGITFDVELDQNQIETSDTEQTIVMRLKASAAVTVDGIGFLVVKDAQSLLSIAAITGGEKIGAFPAASVNLDTGVAGWSSADSENVTDVTELAVITFTVPANIPAGSYEVGIEALELTKDYGEIWENQATAAATLVVTEAEEAAVGYLAGIAAAKNPVNKGDTVNINVAVHYNASEEAEEESSFNAGEIELQYDNSRLRFAEDASALGTATAEVSGDGTLKLADYGSDKNFGDAVYTLAFEAVSDGPASISMTSAAFINKDKATSEDLVAAALSQSAITLTINATEHAVTLPEGFDGEETVEDGEAYTFAAVNKNYDYTFSAKVAGADVSVTDHGDGTYTIDSVTGDLEIVIASQVGKTRSVTFEGDGKEDITGAAVTATYGTDYTFRIPGSDTYLYGLTGISVGGASYQGYQVADDQVTYTIPGADLTGDVIIGISKTAVPQGSFGVMVNGNGAGAADGYANTVVKGASYTLTLTPEAGYRYQVTATMGGSDVTADLSVAELSYTLANVTGNLVFTIVRTVITDGVTVEEYLTLNGTKMWLIQNDTEVAEGKVPTYDGASMFWSEKYSSDGEQAGSYCYLVVAEDLQLADAKNLVGIQTGSAVTVDYGMDVNKTGKVDASDAQLVYNIYNVLYEGFDAKVTMEKFLRADVNGDAGIDVNDATAIISTILNGTEN